MAELVSTSPKCDYCTGNEINSGTPPAFTIADDKFVVSDIEISGSGSGFTSIPAVLLDTTNQTGTAGTATTFNARQDRFIVADISIHSTGLFSSTTTGVTATLLGGGQTDISLAVSLVAPDGNGEYGINSIDVPTSGTLFTLPIQINLTHATATGGNAIASYGVSDDSFAVTPNSSYYYSSAPTLAISGGVGATATALLGLTTESFAVGQGTNLAKYSVPPQVIIASNSGFGAIARAILNDTGVITEIAILASGSGYTDAPTVTLTGGINDGGTVPTVTSNATHFQLVGVVVTAAGTGFSTIPFNGCFGWYRSHGGHCSNCFRQRRSVRDRFGGIDIGQWLQRSDYSNRFRGAE